MARTSGGTIAVVGLACRFPGADDITAYWRLLRDGRHAFSTPPADRWNHAAFFSAQQRANDRYYSPHGAFVSDIRRFAALEFGIPPRRVEVMDPQQRMLLECSWFAMQDAGYAASLEDKEGARPMDRRRVGTWVGLTATEYKSLLSTRIAAQMMMAGTLGRAPANDEEAAIIAASVGRVVSARAFTAPGVLANMSAAVVAQELDLGGPAYTVDAACASALVAVHDAVTFLRDGQIDVALAGGAYLNLTPENLIAFSRIGAISARGVCRPFDLDADGFVQGEGAGMVVLKRLEDAVRDNDRIYAVIRGTAMNNDGRGDGPMSPRAEGQTEVIRAAWDDAGIHGDSIGYVEAHGTGTTVGDRTELTALRRTLGAPRAPIPLGSVKANIGHTMSAAGVAGLIKMVLAVHHKTILPLANWTAPHPDHELDDGTFTIPTAATPWRSVTPRRGTVSSFGFGGTNAHLVIEEAPSVPTSRVTRVFPVPARRAALPAQLVVLSADDGALLARYCAEVAASLPEAGDLAAVAHTLNLARRRRAVRVAIVCASIHELDARLRKVAATLAADPTARGALERDVVVGDAEAPVPVAFLCPGQGMQRVGLLRDWLGIPAFAATLAECEEVVRDILPRPLRDYLYAPEATDDALTDTAVAQPAMFAIGLAVARVLADYGVSPSIILGHSLGEFTAAALSGGAPIADTLRFVAERGRAMADLPGDHGAMAACMAAPEEIEPHLEPGVTIANRNHPRQNVISGATAGVERSVERMLAAGMKARRIPVSHAFHSPVLEAVQDDVDRGLAQVRFAAPSTPMASCIAAARPATADDVRAIFRRHAVSPVEYVRGLGMCRGAGARIYVQLSAGATLAAFVRGVLADDEAVLSVASEQDDGGHGLLRVLAFLAANGHPVDLSGFGDGLATLPPTPLSTQVYWGVGDDLKAPSVAALGTNPTASATTPDPAPAGRPSDAAPDPKDVRARVLAAVSKVSAFPTDALRADQKIFEDLGFDSLMLQELSTRLGENFPGFPGLPRSLFATNPTIDDLVRHVEGGDEAEVALTDPTRPLGAWAPTLRLAPLSGRGRAGGEATVLVRPTLDDLRRAARALAPGADLAVISEVLPDDPLSGGVSGYVKALAREWPAHKVVLVDGTEAEARAELAAAERDVEVVWRNGARYVMGLAPAPAAPRTLTGQRVLLTGGTGWLGRVLGRALADAGAEVVVLGSRPDAAEALAAIGAAARYVRADLRDGASIAAALPAIGRVDGLVHAAGALADGVAGTVDGAGAWDVKVGALARLAEALGAAERVAPLWVASIGSQAGRFGNAFQTEYAAANDGLAALGRRLARAGVQVVTQVWGPWAGSDMVATIPAAARREMRERGVWFVDLEQGVRAFLDTLGASGEVVLGLDLPEHPRAIEVEVPLDPSFGWLRDHALYGRPTVPMAMVMEWADALGRAIGVEAAVEDLTLFDGLVVEQPIAAHLRLDSGRFTATMGGRLAWRGRVVADSRPLPEPEPTGPTAACELDLPTFYARHTFHGPLLRGVLSVEGVGEGGVLGRVRVGDAAAWEQEPWRFGPLAIDSGFQLAAIYARVRFARGGFPVRVARWRSRPLDGATELRVVGRFEASTGDRFTGSIWFLAEDGRVVGLAEGIEAELRADAASEPEVQVAAEHLDFAKFPAWLDLRERLDALPLLGIANPYFKVLEGVARDTVTIGGRELLHFSGYNYLGYSGHPHVERRVIEAVQTYGTSVSASRVASGERPIHVELERRIAEAVGVEDAVVFTAGHATNVTTIGHLFGPKDLILHDEYIHDSGFQGMRLSGATRRPFPHGDTHALERMLHQLRGNFEKCLILVEGVYSMDGDLCDLPRLIELKRRFKTFLMVDEAHSFGVVGARGYGVAEHYGCDAREIDIWMGTLSKSLSSCGGYIAGTKVLCDLLKYTAPGFVYSAGLTPANTAAAIASLELMEQDTSAVATLQHNAQVFYAACVRHGLDTGPSRGESGVVPVIVGNSFHALLLSDGLMKRGINVQPILYPAVADDASRLRFFLSSLHSDAQLERAAAETAAELAEVRAQHGA